MALTHEDLLNSSSDAHAISVSLAQLRVVPLPTSAATTSNDGSTGFGSLLKALVPGLRTRTGLPSQVTHVEELPGRIHAVTSEDGVTNFPIVYGTTAPAVGEVQVIYDDAGIPTLTFQAVVTGYRVEKTELPAGFNAALETVGA